MDKHLQETALLDFSHPDLARLIAERGWAELPPYELTGAVYTFVKDEIPFGYNRADHIAASEVLADGYGQCNTKSTLFMALLRACGVPCRLHGFTIHKALQRGAITGLLYLMAPAEIIHTWVEAQVDGRWLNLEGIILDRPYLAAVQERFAGSRAFCGFAVATKNLGQPGVDWLGEDTYIQAEGIARDLGVFDSPDDFYQTHGSNLSGPKAWFYANWGRKKINRRIARLRKNI